MAVIKVQGTIEKFYPSGKGFVVAEIREYKDKTFNDKFSIWTEKFDGLSIGDKVTVTGRPAASGFAGDDGKIRATIGLNEPTITKADDVF